MSDRPSGVRERCVAEIHVRPAMVGAEVIEWQPHDGSPFRSLESTCALCPGTLVYEWGIQGGMYRVRRTVLAGRGKVLVTPTATRRQAWSWWEALKAGRAV